MGKPTKTPNGTISWTYGGRRFGSKKAADKAAKADGLSADQRRTGIWIRRWKVIGGQWVQG